MCSFKPTYGKLATVCQKSSTMGMSRTKEEKCCNWPPACYYHEIWKDDLKDIQVVESTEWIQWNNTFLTLRDRENNPYSDEKLNLFAP